MHAEIEKRRRELVALCRRHGVERLEAFGSAVRAGDFALSRSDADFLVTFVPAVRNNLSAFVDFKDAVERLRRIRQVDEKHHLTLLCRDLSELANYARVDNKQYRLLKSATPGPYTFLLEATKEVPRRVSHPSRRTIGLRVPDHRVTQELLAVFGQPLLATTLIPPGESDPLNDPHEIRERFEKQIQAVVDAGACAMEPTTVVDLTDDEPRVVRVGRGPLEALGLA